MFQKLTNFFRKSAPAAPSSAVEVNEADELTRKFNQLLYDNDLTEEEAAALEAEMNDLWARGWDDGTEGSELSAGELSRLRQLYRAGARLCHPDKHVAAEQAPAEGWFKHLGALHARRDLPGLEHALARLAESRRREQWPSLP